MARQSINVGEYLLSRGAPEDIAVVDRAGSHTYTDLRRAVGAILVQLAGWNLEPGSRIGLLSRNSFFWVAAYLAVLHSGNVVVPFAAAATPQDVAVKARFVGCEALLVDGGIASRFTTLLGAARHVADEQSMQHAPTAAEPVASTAPDDLAALMFTSGTTSRPRAVRVTHRNIRANTESIISYLELTSRDRILVVLPFSYCYGASLLHTHLRAGAGLAICETAAFPETIIEAIQRDRCTGFAGVPSTYQILLHASSYETIRLPTLRYLQQAGGRLPQRQLDRVAAAQPHARLFVMYGQTEATARLSYLPPGLREERRGSIGRGIPGVSLSVLAPDGRPVPPGTVGEIFARGENITAGYWNDLEGTTAKFVDGGLRTGDLAHVDDDGFIYIDDRQDDFIKAWGVRVSSHEIEDSVLAARDVSGAAVVGRPDDEAGEAIVLFYVPATDPGPAPAEILERCRAALARHMVPREVRRLTRMPINENGKVVKAELRRLAAEPEVNG